jgi:CDGSH-type Zn-finger protein
MACRRDQRARRAVDSRLAIYGNLEIISGTGRVVSRAEAMSLCRCGQSNTKPNCDGSHSRVGFRSTRLRLIVARASGMPLAD